MLFVAFWAFMTLGSILVSCDPSVGDLAFGACDTQQGHLQVVLEWLGLPTLPVAALLEWRWRWLGPALLLLISLLFVAIASS